MQLGDTRVKLAIRAWANPAEVWAVQTLLLRTIRERFDAEGISIPLPPRQVTALRDRGQHTREASLARR
jgi:small conductance mechanosensitive channel